MYIMEQMCLDLGIETPEAIYVGSCMLEDGCTEEEVLAYIERCFGKDAILKNIGEF